MTGEGYQVDADSLRQAAQGMFAATQQLSQQWTAFGGSVAGRGDIFGDDMVGGLIGASHAAALNMVDKSIASVFTAMDGLTNKVAAMADTYDTAEYDSIATINQVGS